MTKIAFIFVSFVMAFAFIGIVLLIVAIFFRVTEEYRK